MLFGVKSVPHWMKVVPGGPDMGVWAMVVVLGGGMLPTLWVCWALVPIMGHDEPAGPVLEVSIANR